MSERKLRLLHLLVQPVLVWDDGAELSPGPETRANALSVSEVHQLLGRITDEIAKFAAGLNTETGVDSAGRD